MKTQAEIDEEHRLYMQSPEVLRRARLLEEQRRAHDAELRRHERRSRYLKRLPTGKRERVEAHLADKSLYLPQWGSCNGVEIEVIQVERWP